MFQYIINLLRRYQKELSILLFIGAVLAFVIYALNERDQHSENFMNKIPDLKNEEDYKKEMMDVEGNYDEPIHAENEEWELTKEPANLSLYCNQYGCYES